MSIVHATAGRSRPGSRLAVPSDRGRGCSGSSRRAGEGDAARVRLGVERPAGPHEPGDVRDRVPDPVPGRAPLQVHRLVQVHRAGRVEGEERDVAQVGPAVRERRGPRRLRQHGGRERAGHRELGADPVQPERTSASASAVRSRSGRRGTAPSVRDGTGGPIGIYNVKAVAGSAVRRVAYARSPAGSSTVIRRRPRCGPAPRRAARPGPARPSPGRRPSSCPAPPATAAARSRSLRPRPPACRADSSASPASRIASRRAPCADTCACTRRPASSSRRTKVPLTSIHTRGWASRKAVNRLVGTSSARSSPRPVPSPTAPGGRAPRLAHQVAGAAHGEHHRVPVRAGRDDLRPARLDDDDVVGVVALVAQRRPRPVGPRPPGVPERGALAAVQLVPESSAGGGGPLAHRTSVPVRDRVNRHPRQMGEGAVRPNAADTGRL